MGTATSSLSVQDVVKRAEGLERPEPTDVRYPRDEWRNFLTGLSADDALVARERCSDTFAHDVLTGLAGLKSESRELVADALGVQQMNEDRPTDRVRNRANSALRAMPLVSACLLCGWVDRVEVYSRSYYKENVRDAIGYYHPDEHYIEVGSDSSDPSHNWARNTDHRSTPEYSTTIHELGHALHYMNGVRIRRPDTLNNNEKDDIKLNLQSGVTRNYWQESFLWEGIEGYYNVWQKRYDSLRALSKYQKKTLEEFYAIAFEAWVTAPSTLLEEQPVAWRAFERIP